MINYCEISTGDYDLKWTSSEYAKNFIQSKDVYFAGKRECKRSGTVSLSNIKDENGRFLLWEYSAGLLMLREHSLYVDLVDNAIIINLGEYGIFSENYFLAATLSTDEINLECRFLFMNLNILTFSLKSSSPSISIISELLFYSKGRILDLSTQMTRANALVRNINSHIPRNERTILSSYWISQQYLVIGFTKGMILLVDCSDITLQFKTFDEMHLNGIFSGIVNLKNVFSTQDKPDILAVVGNQDIIFSIDSHSNLKTWNVQNSSCIYQQSLTDIFFDESIDFQELGLKFLSAKLSMACRNDPKKLKTNEDIFLGIAMKFPGISSPLCRWHLLLIRFNIDLSNHSVSFVSKNTLILPFSTDSSVQIVNVDFSLNLHHNLLFCHCDVNFDSFHNDSKNSNEHNCLYDFNDIYDKKSLSPIEIHNFKGSIMNQLSLEDRDYQNDLGLSVVDDSNSNEFPEYLMLLHKRMLKRIFHPDRFSYDIINSTLKWDIPYEIQTFLAGQLNGIDQSLPEQVLMACQVWSEHMVDEISISFEKQPSYQNQNQNQNQNHLIDCTRRVYLLFIELCEKRYYHESHLTGLSISSSSSINSSGLPFNFVVSRNCSLSIILPVSSVCSLQNLSSIPNNTNSFIDIISGFLMLNDHMDTNVSRIIDSILINSFDNILDIKDSLGIIIDKLKSYIHGTNAFLNTIANLQKYIKAHPENQINEIIHFFFTTLTRSSESLISNESLDSNVDNILLSKSECFTNLVSKFSLLFLSKQHESYKFGTVSCIFIYYFLSDFIDISGSKDLIFETLMKNTAYLVYTFYLKKLSAQNILSTENRFTEFKGLENFNNLSESLSAKMLNWTTTTTSTSTSTSTKDLHLLNKPNALLGFTSLWDNLWKVLSPQLAKIQLKATPRQASESSESNSCVLKSALFWEHINYALQSTFHLSYSSKFLLSLKSLNQPVLYYKTSNTISSCLAPFSLQLEPKFQFIFECVERAQVSYGSFLIKMYQLMSFNSNSLSKIFDIINEGITSIQKVSDLISDISDLDQILPEFSLQDIIFKWASASKYHDEQIFGSMLLLGESFNRIALFDEIRIYLALISSLYLSNNKHDAIDNLIKLSPEVIVIFTNIDHLIKCLRIVEFDYNPTSNNQSLNNISILLWRGYIDQIEKLNQIFISNFPNISFSKYIVKRTRDAYIQLARLFQNNHSFDDSIKCVIEMIHLDQISFDPEQLWKQSLRNLTMFVCDHGQFSWLCSLAEVKVGEVSLNDVIISELEKISFQSDITKGIIISDEGTSFFECLICFHILKKDLLRASEASISFFKMFNEDIERNDRSMSIFSLQLLSLAINLVIIFQHDQSALCNPGTFHNLNVSLRKLNFEFVKLFCLNTVQKSAPNYLYDGKISTIIYQLKESEDYLEGVNLIVQSLLNPSEPREYKLDLLNVLFKDILNLCLLIDPFEMNQTFRLKIDSFDYFSLFPKYSLSLGMHVQSSEAILKYTHDLLIVLNNKKFIINNKINDFFLQSNQISKFPNFIVTYFVKGIFDPRLLLDIYIKQGFLSEACKFGEAYMALLINKEKQVFQQKITVPYNHLDRLIHICNLALQQNRQVSFKSLDFTELEFCLSRLQLSIERYFITLRGIE